MAEQHHSVQYTYELTDEDLVSRILFRDQLVIVVNKPSGIMVHPGPHRRGPSMEDHFAALKFDYKEIPRLAHRLDRDTSGCLVLGRNDRALRILSLTSPYSQLDLVLLHKVQDMVQRTPWTSASFTPSADYVYAGAAHKAAHNVYVWDRVSGVLLKMLEGPKDFVVGVDWHPHRPVVASASNTGAVHIWFSPADEIWSAYADGFEELDENVEYQEAEDEFDFDEHESTSRRRQHEQEAAHVRVTDGEQQHGGARKRCEVDKEEVYAMLGIDREKGGKWERALEKVLDRTHRLARDEGWKAAPGKEEEEVRELEFTLLDDDDSDAFVIPPRLEIDYSDFHDDHL